MAKLILSKVSKNYPNGYEAVRDFSMEIDNREFIVLVGPSGCGKSTVLRMIAGLEDISGGLISIDDKVVNNISAREREIAMVFQNYALYPHMTVYDNLAFGLRLQNLSSDEIKDRINNTAKILGIENILQQKPKSLSGNQRQRIAIGRAMVRNPKLYLMDEPLSNLDASLRVKMRTELTRLHKELDTTVIYVTNDQVEAMTLATRIVAMKNGIIQQIGTPSELYNHPANVFVAGFIGLPQINLLEATCYIEDKVAKLVVSDDFTITLSKARSKNLVELGYNDKAVILGIRPEHIDDSEIRVNLSPCVYEATVNVYEMLGSDAYLYFNIGESSITAKVNPRTTARVGDSIKFAFDVEKIHVFDADTEEALTN